MGGVRRTTARINRPHVLVAIVAFAVGACASRSPAVPAPVSSTEGPALDASVDGGDEGGGTDAGPEPPTPPITWLDAMRLERWTDAARLLDAEPEATRAQPPIRYARARAALGLSDGRMALASLDGLEGALPALASDILRSRAEAQLLAGPVAEGAAYFAQSAHPRDLLRAAAAFAKAGMIPAARNALDRAQGAAARAKNTRDEAAARRMRVELLKSRGREGEAAGDLRWLASHGSFAAGEALSAPALPSRPRVATRGTQSGGEAEAQYEKARVLARSGSDDRAIEGFRGVAQRFPSSPFASRAEFQAARLELIAGHYDAAASAYARLLRSSALAGDRRSDAEHGYGLALLSSGHATEARHLFHKLVQQAPAARSGRLRELEAVAAQRAGDETFAAAVYKDLATKEPLTFAALVSRARLVELGERLPPITPDPAVPPKGAPPPLELRLPPEPSIYASIGLDAEAEEALTGLERQVRTHYPSRENEALCGLYGMISRARRRYRIGVAAADATTLVRAPGTRDRWAWDCVYPEPFGAAVAAVERAHALPRGLVHAVMRQESGFDPTVISPANAIGLMQIIPSTARRVASELALPYDDAMLLRPDMSIQMGAYYLKKLLGLFARNVVLAAAAYNAGPRAVAHWIEGGSDNEIDLWVARIPYEETRNYVVHVVQNLLRYQYLSGGEAAVMALPIDLRGDVRVGDDAY